MGQANLEARVGQRNGIFSTEFSILDPETLPYNWEELLMELQEYPLALQAALGCGGGCPLVRDVREAGSREHAKAEFAKPWGSMQVGCEYLQSNMQSRRSSSLPCYGAHTIQLEVKPYPYLSSE